MHGIEHRVRTNHCSNRSLVQAFSGSLCLWLHYELLPASLSWPLLPSLGALLTMPLANSPEASCVLSLSFKDLYGGPYELTGFALPSFLPSGFFFFFPRHAARLPRPWGLEGEEGRGTFSP